MDLSRSHTRRAALAAALLAVGPLAARADEPSRLARFFRPAAKPAPSAATRQTGRSSMPADVGAGSGPSTPAPAAGSTPKIVPQPRTTRAATEADPVLSRVALGRSDDGKPFAMSMHVFLDGTVIDSEGVHKLGPDAMRPLLQLLATGDLQRTKGHCGAASTDFIEQVHVVVFEKSLGKLKANAFSYAGNGQGCDESIYKLHAALDAIQMKLSPPTPAPTAPEAPRPLAAYNR